MSYDLSFGPPAADTVRHLLQPLDAYLGRLYPAESNHIVPPEMLAGPAYAFCTLRVDGVPLGCGAIRAEAGWGEIKRVYVRPAARGQGMGAAIMAALLERARAQHLALLRLETGIHQAEAVAMFLAHGFRPILPFADYRPDPLSVFMERRL